MEARVWGGPEELSAAGTHVPRTQHLFSSPQAGDSFQLQPG